MKRPVGHVVIIGGVLAAMLWASFAKAADPFTLSSPAFADGGMLAVKNASANRANPNCVGQNISPPFKWTNVPEGTKSFALLMFDPDGRGGLGASHWVSYGIPATVTGFAEGEVSQPSDKYVGGKGSAGLTSYSGPCPPPGGWHHYIFTLIATDLEPKALAPGLTREELLAALAGHSKGAAGLIGRFAHPD